MLTAEPLLDPSIIALAKDVRPVDKLSAALEAVMDEAAFAVQETTALQRQEGADEAAFANGVCESIALQCRDEGATAAASGLQPWERLPTATAATSTALLPPTPGNEVAFAPALPPAVAPAKPSPPSLLHIATLQAQIAAMTSQLAEIQQSQDSAATAARPAALAVIVAGIAPSTSASPVAAVTAAPAEPFMEIAHDVQELSGQALPMAINKSLALAPLVAATAPSGELLGAPGDEIAPPGCATKPPLVPMAPLALEPPAGASDAPAPSAMLAACPCIEQIGAATANLTAWRYAVLVRCEHMMNASMTAKLANHSASCITTCICDVSICYNPVSKRRLPRLRPLVHWLP